MSAAQRGSFVVALASSSIVDALVNLESLVCD
jgi:hypothetical protein